MQTACNSVRRVTFVLLLVAIAYAIYSPDVLIQRSFSAGTSNQAATGHSAEQLGSRGIALYHPRIIINRDLNREALKKVARGVLKDDYANLVRSATTSPAPVFCNVTAETFVSMIYGYGYLYQMSGNAAYADALINNFLKPCAKPSFGGTDDGAYVLEAYAIAYDWTYDRISSRDSAAAANPSSPDYGLKTFVQNTIVNYYKLLSSPAYLQDSIRESDFHNYMTEIEFSYLAAGLALYGDRPEAEEMIERGWGMINDGYAFDPTGFGTKYTYKIKDSINILTGGAMNWEGPVYWRNAAPETLRAIEAYDTATNRAHDEWHTDFASVVNAGYYKLYCMRADLTMPNMNDADPGQRLSWKDNFGLAILQGRFKDGYIKELIDTNQGGWYGGYGTGVVMKLLFYDATVRNRRFTDLALSRQFGREIYMRSGWGPHDTFITFTAGFGGVYHGHLDNNGFTLFRDADLALNGGAYTLRGPYYQNYFKRTVASNSITVTDPTECWRDTASTCTLSNDGGQRWELRRFNPPYQTKEFQIDRLWSGTEMINNPEAQELFQNATKTFETTPAYDYIISDATKAYTNRWSGSGSNTKARVSQAVRELFFLRPNYIIILDRVTSTNPSFQKAWLLHSINPPAVRTESWTTAPTGITNFDGTEVRIDNGKGRLFVKVILPAAARVQAIGGRGYEGWVNGANYWDPTIRNTVATWRIEIQPTVPATSDLFLNVLYAINASASAMPASKRVESDTAAGALIDDATARAVIIFAKNGSKRNQISYVATYEGTARHYLADMAAGAYDVFRNETRVQTALSVSPHGVLTFSAEGGNFRVSSAAAAASQR